MTDDSEVPLEVIELEPATPSPRRRDPRATTTGVRGRRAPVIVAIVVVVGLVVSVIAGRSPHHDHAAGTTSTNNARKTTINLRGGGPLFPVRVGARVLTGGPFGLRLVDTDTGAVAAPNVAGLPDGEVTIVAHSGPTVAVQVGEQIYWFTMSLLVAHRIDADTAFPAVEPGHLWLASAQYATEVPGDPNRLPRGRVTTAALAIGATREGLLENLQTGEGAWLQSTSGAQTSRSFLPADATVIGVHADRVAWVAGGCGVLRCPVHVTEVKSGKTSDWLQLPGHPSPLSLAGSTALFAPDGSRVAIVVPDNNVTNATTLVIADLRDRTTTVANTTGYVAAPARPGSGDGAGATLDWTRDGAYLVLAPELGTGAGRLAIVDPATGRVMSSRQSLDIGSTTAAVGSSSLGALDLPRRTPGPIASGPTSPLVRPRLQLIGGDTVQVDLLDLGTQGLRTLQIGAVLPNPSGPHSFARLTTGWLVVRNAFVELMRTGSADNVADFVEAGNQVYASNRGRTGWITIGNPAGAQTVRSYDAGTGALGRPFTAEHIVGAVDAGVVLTHEIPATTQTVVGTEIAVADGSGHERTVAEVYSSSLTVLATGGATILYSDEAGLHALHAPSGSTQLLADAVRGAAVSADGTQLAWIRADGRAVAARLDSHGDFVGYSTLDATADRVLVANDGTVLFTKGLAVWVGRAGVTRSQRVHDLAPDPSSELALS